MSRFLDRDWLRRDLPRCTLVESSDAPGAVLETSGANRLNARSLTFGPDGTLDHAVVRVTCGDGVEREGTRTFAHEARDGRRLVLSQRIEFDDAECTEETTYRWGEQGGFAVPVEIRRRIAAGREYDDTTFRLSGWKLEVGK